MPNSRRDVKIALFTATVLLSGALCALAQSPLRLNFDGNTVAVSELEPGAGIVYFSVSRSVGAFVPRNERRSLRLLDEDLDGEVRIPLEAPRTAEMTVRETDFPWYAREPGQSFPAHPFDQGDTP